MALYRSDVLSGFLIGAIAASLTVSTPLSIKDGRDLMVPFSLSKQALYVSTIFKPRPSCDMALLPQTRGDIELHSNSPASADEK